MTDSTAESATTPEGRNLDLRGCQCLMVRPGDKLVIAVPQNIRRDELDRLREGVEKHLSGVEAVVVSANQLVVYRPENPEG